MLQIMERAAKVSARPGKNLSAGLRRYQSP